MKRFRTSLSILGLGLVGALLILAEGGTNPVSLINKPPMPPQPQAFPVGGSGLSNRQGFVESYGKLPLGFESNEGQTDLQVKFLARGRGYALFLTDNEAVLSLNRLHPPKRELEPKQHCVSEYEAPEVLHMKLVGASTEARVAGLQELPGKVNYFIGNDPKKWRTNVATFAKVKYRDVYPGVDLLYYGNQGRLEYDFVVAPGAGSNAITLALDSDSSRREGGTDVKPLQIDANGDLVAQIDGGEVRFHKPVVYQPRTSRRQSRIDGQSYDKIFLDGRYVVLADNRVQFEVPGYDRNSPLVIDPVLDYSTYLGGSGNDSGSAIAVDSAGSAYLTGTTASTDFPVVGGFQPSLAGNLFIAKLNPSGNALVYSTILGGTGNTQISYGIAVDSSGNAYITGWTSSSDFPTANAFQSAPSAAANAFVTKLNPAGNALVYSTYLSGSGGSSAYALAVDGSGSAYVAGNAAAGFPTVNAFQTAYGGNGNVFVTKFSAAGNSLVYSSYLGGSGGDSAGGIAVDSSGNAYVTGKTNSANFPTLNPFQSSPGTDGSAFVTKFNATGNALVYSTYLGGNSTTYGAGIAVDSSGNAYVTGATLASDFPTLNRIQPWPGLGDHAFLTKFSAAGNTLGYSTYLGGSEGNDYGNGIAVDSSGNAYVTGTTSSGDFPQLNPVEFYPCCYQNAFVTKINAAGSTFAYSTFLGGRTQQTEGNGIALDSSGDAYVTGATAATDFPTVKPLQLALAGGNDVFVAKLSAAGPWAILSGAGAFPVTQVGVGSVPNPILLTSTGTTDVLISTVSVAGTNAGDFTLSADSCQGATVAPSGTCSVQVTFTPSAIGPRSAMVVFTDNTNSSPQSVPVNGIGGIPTASLSATALNYASQTAGTTSQAQTINVSDSGSAQLTVSSVALSGTNAGDFAISTDHCTGTTLAPGSPSCSMSVTFTPTAVGARTGMLRITDNAPDSPQTVALSGSGEDFGVAVASGSSSSATVTAGGTASYTLSVLPLGGFNQAINLSCSGAPSLSTCTLSQNSVTLNGTAAASVTATVTTTAPTLMLPRMPRVPPFFYGRVASWLLIVMVFAFLSLRRKRVRQPAYLVFGLLLIAATIAACGGGGGGVTHTLGTPAGTYTLTITGTSGSVSHNTTVTLTVN